MSESNPPADPTPDQTGSRPIGEWIDVPPAVFSQLRAQLPDFSKTLGRHVAQNFESAFAASMAKNHTELLKSFNLVPKIEMPTLKIDTSSTPVRRRIRTSRS
jgi:hypothetical protein